MGPKSIIAILGVLASVALAVGLAGLGPAEAGRGDADAEVRAGDAVVNGSDVRIEGGPTVEDGEASVGDDPGEEEVREEADSAPASGEVVMTMKGDEGVAFSGTCSVGGEERQIEGQVPEELTFALDGGKLECEIRKEGEGTLKLSLVAGDDRVTQSMSGDTTMKLTYSGDGVSSSTTSTGSGSSSIVQSSSSSSSSVIQQSSSSSTER